jgi:hypothetical protein
MNNKRIVLIIVLVFFLILAWSPWITKEYAEKKAADTFNSAQNGIIDGCGLNCEGCGVVSSQKLLFGHSVILRNKCGIKNNYRDAKEFVSVFGIVFLLP